MQVLQSSDGQLGHASFSLSTLKICACLVLLAFLSSWFYIAFVQPQSNQTAKRPDFLQEFIQTLGLGNIFVNRSKQHRSREDLRQPARVDKKMRYNRSRRSKKKRNDAISEQSCRTKPKQPFDMFIVLDIEGTCNRGSDFNFPNEIIEFPVCLMQWNDKAEDGSTNDLEVIAEFRSFVRPTWRPILSEFCTQLTGIEQAQIDTAPVFTEVLASFERFLVEQGLLNGATGERLVKFCWCSDGPFDIRDFIVKQCFISQVTMPQWLQGDVMDVRTLVLQSTSLHSEKVAQTPTPRAWTAATRRSLNIPAQLKILDLPAFEGRQHSGIDDTRNIARIVTELARRGVSLLPNTAIHPDRRWSWMGKHGQVMGEYLG